MKKRNRFISLALTLGLALSVMAMSVSASKFVDAHGNELELDDTLEAYSSVVLSGADNAAVRRRPIWAICGPTRCGGSPCPARSMRILTRTM